MITRVEEFLSSAPIAGLALAALGFITVLFVMPSIIGKFALMLSGRREKQFHQTHKLPVPRFGGLALAAAFVVIAPIAIVFSASREGIGLSLSLVFTSLAMFGLGFWDDISPLGAKKKLLGQVVIAIVAFYCGLKIETFKNPFSGEIYALGPWALATTVFWLVALTNLINLVDGIDGLAGGIAVMLMCLLVYVGFHSQSFSYFVALGMAGALVGFLQYNFPPAKIYMGDGGAYFLGYLIGALTIQNSNKGTIAAALIAPIFALALPILDVSLSIIRRGVQGLPIFRPDRRHIHHRLLHAGLSRRRAVLTLYGVSLLFLGLAFIAFWSNGKLAPILFGCVFLVLLIAAPSLGIIKNWFAVGQVLGNSLDMRKEVQYALSLRNWLELEAERAESVEKLWADFGFVAKKIGFVEATLIVDGEPRSWVAEDVNGALTHFVRHDLHIEDKPVGIEFRATHTRMNDKLFMVLSELAAEGWLQASMRWRQTRNVPFEFCAPAPKEMTPRAVVRDSVAA